MKLTEQTSREIDTQIAKLEEPLGGFLIQIASCKAGIEDRKVNPKRYAYPSATTIEQLEVQIKEIQAKIAAVREAIKPLEAEWMRRGCWPRYFSIRVEAYAIVSMRDDGSVNINVRYSEIN